VSNQFAGVALNKNACQLTTLADPLGTMGTAAAYPFRCCLEL
jgi:hypothetical protein